MGQLNGCYMHLTFGKNRPRVRMVQVPHPTILGTTNWVIDPDQLRVYGKFLYIYSGETYLGMDGYKGRFKNKTPKRFFRYAGGNYQTMVNYCTPMPNERFDPFEIISMVEIFLISLGRFLFFYNIFYVDLSISRRSILY